MTIKFPDITVPLSGQDGNAFFIIGRVMRALKASGHSREVCDQFMVEATSGDYDHVLRTTMRWVNVS